MKLICLVLLTLACNCLVAQSYSNSYAGRAYSQAGYHVARNYALSPYSFNDDDSMCLTCNHCQIPAAFFNPGFPLVLMGFQAERQSSKAVHIRWSWLADREASYAELLFLPSREGDFQTLRRWKGNIPEEFVHDNASPGATWYRLRVADAEGKVHLSKVREVSGATGLKSILVYPNPSNGTAFLRSFGLETGPYRIRMMDVSGKGLMDSQIKLQENGQDIAIPGISRLPSGVYLLELRGTQGRFRTKLVKR